MEIVREIGEWHSRRRRFAEEWAFHRDLAVSEFESLGLSRREARRLAVERLGSRSAHRRSALRYLRADYVALFDFLPWYGIKVSPLLTPAIIVIALAAILMGNPHRVDAIVNSLSVFPFTPARHVTKFVPLTPSGIVPMELVAATSWSFVLIGMAQIAATTKLRVHWRVWAFALGTLLGLTILNAVLWATTLEVIMQKRWTIDAVQGAAIAAMPFACVGWTFVALRVWYHDLLSRCPVCLRRLGMAETRGNVNNLLIAPTERETICLRGHGTNIETRWTHTFNPDQFASLT